MESAPANAAEKKGKKPQPIRVQAPPAQQTKAQRKSHRKGSPEWRSAAELEAAWELSNKFPLSGVFHPFLIDQLSQPKLVVLPWRIDMGLNFQGNPSYARLKNANTPSPYWTYSPDAQAFMSSFIQSFPKIIEAIYQSSVIGIHAGSNFILNCTPEDTGMAYYWRKSHLPQELLKNDSPEQIVAFHPAVEAHRRQPLQRPSSPKFNKHKTLDTEYPVSPGGRDDEYEIIDLDETIEIIGQNNESKEPESKSASEQKSDPSNETGPAKATAMKKKRRRRRRVRKSADKPDLGPNDEAQVSQSENDEPESEVMNEAPVGDGGKNISDDSLNTANLPNSGKTKPSIATIKITLSSSALALSVPQGVNKEKFETPTVLAVDQVQPKKSFLAALLSQPPKKEVAKEPPKSNVQAAQYNVATSNVPKPIDPIPELKSQPSSSTTSTTKLNIEKGDKRDIQGSTKPSNLQGNKSGAAPKIQSWASLSAELMPSSPDTKSAAIGKKEEVKEESAKSVPSKSTSRKSDERNKQPEARGSIKKGEKDKKPISLQEKKQIPPPGPRPIGNQRPSNLFDIGLLIDQQRNKTSKISHRFQHKSARKPKKAVVPAAQKRRKLQRKHRPPKPSKLKTIIIQERERVYKASLLSKALSATLAEKSKASDSQEDQDYVTEDDENANPAPKKETLRELFSRLRKVPKIPVKQNVLPDYCDQVMTKEFNQMLSVMVSKLFEFQERARKKEPLKYARHRRVVNGLREVPRWLRRNKLKCIIISPKVEEVKGVGGIDHIIRTMIADARRMEIPVFFGLTRNTMGRIFKRRARASVIGILSTDGANDLFKTVLNTGDSLRREYATNAARQATPETQPPAPPQEQVSQTLSETQ